MGHARNVLTAAQVVEALAHGQAPSPAIPPAVVATAVALVGQGYGDTPMIEAPTEDLQREHGR